MLSKRIVFFKFYCQFGHGTIRTKVMGLDYQRYSTQEERNLMHELIHEAMREGCIGLSAGLDYDPDVYASHDEIVESVAQLKEYGTVYCPHWRRTGRRRGVAAGHIPNEKITALMESCGFMAYPYEFWHYSKGDAYAEKLRQSGRQPRYGAVHFDPGTGAVEPVPNPERPLHSLDDIRRRIELALGRLRGDDGACPGT